MFMPSRTSRRSTTDLFVCSNSDRQIIVNGWVISAKGHKDDLVLLHFGGMGVKLRSNRWKEMGIWLGILGLDAEIHERVKGLMIRVSPPFVLGLGSNRYRRGSLSRCRHCPPAAGAVHRILRGRLIPTRLS